VGSFATYQVANEKRMRMPFINTAVKKVAHSLQVLWPRSRTKIFGSNATGLALPSSDVDLVVSLPPVRKAREPIKQAGILEGRIDGIKETCLLHAARNLETQDWVEVLQVIEHTMVTHYSLYVALLMWVQKQCGYCLVFVHKPISSWESLCWQVPIIRLTAHILPHQCELGDSKPVKVLGEKEKGKASSSPVAANSKGAEVLMTCETAAEVFSQVKGPWGSEADRQFVRLDISFEAPANTGLRTAELVRELMGQFPPITPLALLLKQFLADRSLDHPYKGGLSSYCQVLLITRFLQHQQHLGRPPSSQSLGSLFMDFLHFFG
jgi:predicted nucleotidyltransferase